MLRELSYEELEEMSSTTSVPDSTRFRSGSADRGWPLLGSGCGEAFRFAGVPERREPSMKDILLHKLRD
jgi:hypothetical protein